MACGMDIYALQLSQLPFRTKKLLSNLLESRKIIPSDGPIKLPRDWRGLASLVPISAQVAETFHRGNKTAQVLEIWQRDSTATVGKLLEYLQMLDRYDVHDDVLSDLQDYAANGNFQHEERQVAIQCNDIVTPDVIQTALTVDDDSIEGYTQHYDALLLYADEDIDFIDEICEKLGQTFQLCTKEKLLVGFTTEFGPITELISNRCRNIIMVYSPAFFNDPANRFYRDYAQAVIESNRNHQRYRRIIPIIYKQCQLPPHFMFYCNLHYPRNGRAMYNFWHKLQQSLKPPRLNGSVSTQSGLNIVELPPSENLSNVYSDNHLILPPPTENHRSASLNDIHKTSLTTNNVESNYSQISDTNEKKSNPFKLMLNKIKRKKPKSQNIPIAVGDSQ